MPQRKDSINRLTAEVKAAATTARNAQDKAKRGLSFVTSSETAAAEEEEGEEEKRVFGGRSMNEDEWSKYALLSLSVI